MEVLDRALKNVKDVACKAGNKAEELLCQGKTQLQIRKLRRELKKNYACLGLRIYGNVKGGEEYGPAIATKVNEIDALRRQLSDLKEQADLIQYCRRCKNCGAYNDREDDFCLNCGATMRPYHKTVYTVQFDGEQPSEQQEPKNEE